MHFDWAQLSSEDISRSSSIVANKKRQSLEKVSHNYDDYLRSLQMSAKIGEVSSMDFPRFVQLINKTNQFNLRTKRYTMAEVEDMKKDENCKLIAVSLTDKFSYYGIIAGLIIMKKNKKVFIETWVMSCRVFSRNLEQAIINSIINIIKKWGCDEILGEYLPTKKNRVIQNLYSDLGFNKLKENDKNLLKGTEKYYLIIDDAKKLDHYITIDK